MIKNIIIDCDPGHDDAIAILVALANPKTFNILAVGTVGGNNELSKVTKNAQRILQITKSKIALYKGASKPLVRTLEIQESAHGFSGMDGPVYDEALSYPVQKDFAIDAYKELIEKHDDVRIVALGPLTNLALLLNTYPHIGPKIKEISLMGGGIEKGNITAAAEFNIYADPEAAEIVFKSKIPIIMAGLDVTEKAFLNIQDIEEFNQESSIDQFVYQLLKFYNESGKQFGFEESAMHDACAIIYLLAPEIFTYKEWHVDIITEGLGRGMTLADKRLIANTENKVKVLMDVDRYKFKKIIVDTVASLREEV